jgi:hypothetical protein
VWSVRFAITLGVCSHVCRGGNGSGGCLFDETERIEHCPWPRVVRRRGIQICGRPALYLDYDRGKRRRMSRCITEPSPLHWARITVAAIVRIPEPAEWLTRLAAFWPRNWRTELGASSMTSTCKQGART